MRDHIQRIEAGSIVPRLAFVAALAVIFGLLPAGARVALATEDTADTWSEKVCGPYGWPDRPPATPLPPMPSAREMAERVARCLDIAWASKTAGRAWVEELEAGYRIVVPLRGQPELQDAQFKPPSTDALAWVDLYRYEDSSRAPADIEEYYPFGPSTSLDQSAHRFTFAEGDPVYIARAGGYYWFTLRGRMWMALLEARWGPPSPGPNVRVPGR